MARAVNVSIVTSVGLILNVSGVDRDTTSALLGSLIDVGIVHELCVALQSQVLGDSSGQSGLAVVNVTDGAMLTCGLERSNFAFSAIGISSLNLGFDIGYNNPAKCRHCTARLFY